MGSYRALVLVNIILIEFENVMGKPLTENGVLTFYYIHVDDTLVFIKKDEIHHDLNIFNFFAKNLRPNIDAFDNGNILFVDIKIPNNEKTDIYII